MKPRAVHMVFCHNEYVDSFASLQEAKDKAQQLKDRVGRSYVLTNYLTLKELEEVLEHDISDEEWDRFEVRENDRISQ